MRSENFLLVSLAAEKFGCRPSELVGLADPVVALDFDLAAAARLLQAESAARAGDAQSETNPDDILPRARALHW